MNKIEEKLVITEPADSMILMNAVDKFYKEANMLFNNIYLSVTIFNNEKINTFPLEFDFYDASWYKNLLMSANMLIDRFHYELDETKDYTSCFDSLNECDFLAFAKKWNLINYVVKFNLDDNTWKVKSAEWKVSQTTTWISELITMGIKFNKELFDTVAMNNDLYEPFADAVGRNGYQAIIDYILNNDEKKKAAAKAAASANTSSSTPPPVVEAKEEVYVDPKSPAGVDKEMTKLLEWVLLKQATIRAKNAPDRGEVKEVSPMRKVMLELLEWIDNKEVVCSVWSNRKKYGFDPFEYKAIVDDLKAVTELRAKLDADVDGCLEFATNNDPDTRFKPVKQIHRKYNKAQKVLQEELKLPNHGKDLIKKLDKLSKELKETDKNARTEIALVLEEIEKLNNMLPVEEKINLAEELAPLPWLEENSKDKKKVNKDPYGEEATSSETLETKDAEGSTSTNSEGTELSPAEEMVIANKNELHDLMDDNEINEFIKKTKSKNIDDLAEEKLALIDKELKKINSIMSNNKKAIKKEMDKPISKVSDEMDQIIIWIGAKCDSLKPQIKDLGYELHGKSYLEYNISKIGEEPKVEELIEALINPPKEETKKEEVKKEAKKAAEPTKKEMSKKALVVQKKEKTPAKADKKDTKKPEAKKPANSLVQKSKKSESKKVIKISTKQTTKETTDKKVKTKA